MSSTAYLAELQPDPSLRLGVLVSGFVFAGLGLVVAAQMALDPLYRAVIVFVWISICASELLRQRSAYSDFGALRIAGDGRLKVRSSGGEWRSATLRSGCVVTAWFCWLRISVEHGPDYDELLAGSVRGSDDWRRLQVIWRHTGAWTR